MRRRLVALLVGLLVLGLVAFLALPSFVDARLNRVRPASPARAVPAPVRTLHMGLAICDLHADPLLWGRDLLVRSRRGHVDLPRLVEGNVALQVLGVVTKVPRGLNIHRNEDRTDDLRFLAMAELWPARTWGSPMARALHQAGRLRRMVDASGGRMVLVESREDLRRLLETRRTGGETVGVMLALEGLGALEGDETNLERLFGAGFRMAAPSHFVDTDVGGSAAGVEKHGLTGKGRRIVAEMERLGMVVDLAHASEATVDDVLRDATRPVVVSHTGVKGTCDNPRNLSDGQLRAIAARGGVVGIGFFATAVCEVSPRAIARAIHHAASVAGPDHVALGSDWDGAVATPFDAAGLPELTAALRDEGLGDEAVAGIMGGNAMGLLGRLLPADGAAAPAPSGRAAAEP